MKLIDKTHPLIVTWDVYLAEYAHHYPSFLCDGKLYCLDNAEKGTAVQVGRSWHDVFHPVHEVIPVDIKSVEYVIMTRGEHI